MNLSNLTSLIISLFFTMLVGFFPNFFAISGNFITNSIKNYWLLLLLLTILFLLIFICKLCISIKKQQQT